jgi:hypothetical protein
MKYSSTIYNGNYFHYEILAPKNELLKFIYRIVIIPLIMIYLGFCVILLTGAIPTDIYRIGLYNVIRFKRKTLTTPTVHYKFYVTMVPDVNLHSANKNYADIKTKIFQRIIQNKAS